MINRLKKILSLFILSISLAFGSNAPAYSATNLPMAEVGDFGSWATEQNLDLFKEKIGNDINVLNEQIAPKQLVKDYVPIEAKVGFALMSGLSLVGEILDMSLFRFAIIFILISYAFWILFETYKMMTKAEPIKPFIEKLVKKGAIIAIWLIVLRAGPAQVFMWVMGPIIYFGSYVSDFILNSITTSAGVSLPDTCGAIQEYAQAHMTGRMLIDAQSAADILCVPTRLSGFFLTAVKAGGIWFGAGIGRSGFTSLVGVVFIFLFLFNFWKFMLMGLGVIADLFISILLLPFTAINETIGQTEYKGIAGQIFNGFMGLFKTESLQEQIKRFINATVYFVSLSALIGICAAILSTTVDADLSSNIPTLSNDGFVPTLLTGCLVAYLAANAEKIISDWGGKINNSFGKQVGDDIKNLWNGTKKRATAVINAFKSK